jgi:hypothetical protein
MRSQPEDIGEVVAAFESVDPVQLFDPNAVTSITGVRVFDVGQGDCIGLLDQDRKVFCYFDYGGLADHPERNSPGHMQVHASTQHDGRDLSIVLSHWDKDHYWSAEKKNPSARAGNWLVPRQNVSPSAARFAAELAKARCWPERLGEEPVAFTVGSQFEIEIRKCRGFDRDAMNEDRNLSGLAITVVRKDQDGAKPTAMILLPGDCPFDLIPRRPDSPLRGLVAYHHGSGVHWNFGTMMAIARKHVAFRMVYSFGAAYGKETNAYGHPCRGNYKSGTRSWNSRSRSTEEARGDGDAFVDLRL